MQLALMEWDLQRGVVVCLIRTVERTGSHFECRCRPEPIVLAFTLWVGGAEWHPEWLSQGCAVSRNFYTCVKLVELAEIQALKRFAEIFMIKLNRSAKIKPKCLRCTLS